MSVTVRTGLELDSFYKDYELCMVSLIINGLRAIITHYYIAQTNVSPSLQLQRIQYIVYFVCNKLLTLKDSKNKPRLFDFVKLMSCFHLIFVMCIWL